jgi:hypothetical protein
MRNFESVANTSVQQAIDSPGPARQALLQRVSRCRADDLGRIEWLALLGCPVYDGPAEPEPHPE